MKSGGQGCSQDFWKGARLNIQNECNTILAHQMRVKIIHFVIHLQAIAQNNNLPLITTSKGEGVKPPHGIVGVIGVMGGASFRASPPRENPR